MTVRAIYEKGVFRPIEPVNLPERAEVDVVLPSGTPDEIELTSEQARKEIVEIMSHRYRTGQTDAAARQNKHQP